MSEPVGLARGLTNYGDPDFALYLRRSFARSMGYSTDLLARPVIGIADTFSGFNNCHRHFPELIEAVKRGVLAMGGLPLTFPTISLGEVFLNPTSLMFRNLMAMDTEEMIRAQPMDAVVLVGGCDKTVPAQLMGAISANRPAIQLVAGPMLTARWHGERLGACTDCRRFWAKYRAGEIDAEEIHEIEGNLATTAGTCAVMGTASTMASIAEALGMILPGSAAIPAVHADRLRAAEATGRAAMQLAAAGLTPDRIVTPQSVENALRVLMAIGGSTNAVLHLTAIAGRAGVDIDLERLNEISETTPVLVDLKPTGPHYMEDLFAAGGIGAVLRELKPLLHLDCMTVAGETLAERLAAPAGPVDRSVVKPLADPLQPQGRACRAVRLARAQGRDLQAFGGRPQAVREGGPRRRLHLARGPLGAHRRSGARCDPGRFPGAAECRAAQRLGDARGRLSADPGQAGARRGQGHGAHLRRADERHGLRLDRLARDPRRGERRPARQGPQRRPDPPFGRRAPPRPMVAPEELARRPVAPPPIPERGYAALYRREILQADRGCDFNFLRKHPLAGVELESSPRGIRPSVGRRRPALAVEIAADQHQPVPAATASGSRPG